MYKWEYVEKFNRLVPLTPEGIEHLHPKTLVPIKKANGFQSSIPREPMFRADDDFGNGRKFRIFRNFHKFGFRKERNARAHHGDPHYQRGDIRVL